MLASQKVTVKKSGDKVVATAVDADFGDVFATLFTPDTSLTGTLGFVQLVGVGVAGVLTMNYRHTGNMFNFG